MDDEDCSPAELQAKLVSAGIGLELTFRSMFGGIMAYVNDRPFASLSGVGMALKLADDDRAELLAICDARPLRYKPDDPPSRSYVIVPRAVIEETGTLRGWIDRSVSAAKKQPVRVRKRKAVLRAEQANYRR